MREDFEREREGTWEVEIDHRKKNLIEVWYTGLSVPIEKSSSINGITSY